jgi:hypothetical protein
MNKYNYSIKWTQPYKPTSGWRKRQIIDQFVDDLHTVQLDYIDEAVEKSDLHQAKELIEYIKNKV